MMRHPARHAAQQQRLNPAQSTTARYNQVGFQAVGDIQYLFGGMALFLLQRTGGSFLPVGADNVFQQGGADARRQFGRVQFSESVRCFHQQPGLFAHTYNRQCAPELLRKSAGAVSDLGMDSSNRRIRSVPECLRAFVKASCATR